MVLRLRENKFAIYGVLERRFRNYYKTRLAAPVKTCWLCWSRLDNVGATVWASAPLVQKARRSS